MELHPLRRRDAAEWSRLRVANEAWLSPWEPSHALPWRDRHTPGRPTGRCAARWPRRARLGTSLPFAVRVDGRLAGQVTIDNVVRGALRSGYLGYWIDREVAGRGMASLAVALVCDHAFGAVGLHRVQADIRPENGPSQRLVERLGLPAGGPAAALPRHRRRLARPPRLRAARRGPARRRARPVAAAHTTLTGPAAPPAPRPRDTPPLVTPATEHISDTPRASLVRNPRPA